MSGPKAAARRTLQLAVYFYAASLMSAPMRMLGCAVCAVDVRGVFADVEVARG